MFYPIGIGGEQLAFDKECCFASLLSIVSPRKCSSQMLTALVHGHVNFVIHNRPPFTNDVVGMTK